MELIDKMVLYKFIGHNERYVHIHDIDQLPNANAKPAVYAKWVLIPNGRKSFFSRKCSKCGYSTGYQAQSFNYCPNCGADMRGDDK